MNTTIWSTFCEDNDDNYKKIRNRLMIGRLKQWKTQASNGWVMQLKFTGRYNGSILIIMKKNQIGIIEMHTHRSLRKQDSKILQSNYTTTDSLDIHPFGGKSTLKICARASFMLLLASANHEECDNTATSAEQHVSIVV